MTKLNAATASPLSFVAAMWYWPLSDDCTEGIVIEKVEPFEANLTRSESKISLLL